VPALDLRSRLVDLGFTEGVVTPLTFEHRSTGRSVTEVTGVRAALGTRVSVTGVVDTSGRAEAAIGAAFEELDRLAGIFSRYDATSAVSALNHHGRLLAPPPELLHVATRALAIHSATRKAFDITVKPVLDLLAARLPARPPSDVELAERATLVNARRVRVSRGSIRFTRDGMGVTLDGIAKGYIADRMAGMLELHGMGRYLIDAGGDIRVRGLNGRNRPWTIGVRDPAGGDAFPGVIALTAGAVATSGGYQRSYDLAREYHHIVSPLSGRSPRGVAGASVVAADALTADALATAVVVLGADEGLALIELLPRCAALIVDSQGGVRPSHRWTALAVPPSGGVAS
jgi:thiamine biosynthesis lipoprotein